MSDIDFRRPGAWSRLFPKALELMASLDSAISDARWTFGGGTALMLRIGHRLSNDIDLFVADPQVLGYLTPRLSQIAEAIATDYDESAEYLRLYCAEGKIDIVVAGPLTDRWYDIAMLEDRAIRVETSAEILSKKMWFRGDRATARDLFDLCAIAEMEPDAIDIASPFMLRHGREFLRQLKGRASVLSVQFRAINATGFKADYDDSVDRATQIIARAQATGQALAVGRPGPRKR